MLLRCAILNDGVVHLFTSYLEKRVSLVNKGSVLHAGIQHVMSRVDSFTPQIPEVQVSICRLGIYAVIAVLHSESPPWCIVDTNAGKGSSPTWPHLLHLPGVCALHSTSVFAYMVGDIGGRCYAYAFIW